MSYNKYGEIKLLQDLTHSKPYFVSRDRAGFYVLREGNSNGKEIFATHKDDGKKKNSVLKTAASVLTKKRKPNSAKTDYVNKYVKNGKDYVSEWYKKSNDDLHNFTVRSASANKCRKKASSLRDLLTQEV